MRLSRKSSFSKLPTIQLDSCQLAKEGWFVCLHCIVRSFEKEDFLETSHPVHSRWRRLSANGEAENKGETCSKKLGVYGDIYHPREIPAYFLYLIVPEPTLPLACFYKRSAASAPNFERCSSYWKQRIILRKTRCPEKLIAFLNSGSCQSAVTR